VTLDSSLVLAMLVVGFVLIVWGGQVSLLYAANNLKQVHLIYPFRVSILADIQVFKYLFAAVSY